MSSKNLSQRQFAPSERIAHGQTMTLEEYKALQSQGEEPDTMNRGAKLGIGYFGLSHRQHVNLDAHGRAENKLEAKEALGLSRNDPQYGNPYTDPD
jgi:hypothetical protein